MGGIILLNPYDFYITDEDYAEAANNGISNDRLRQRVRMYGLCKQRALTTPPQIHKNHSHMEEVLMAHNISIQQYRWRVNNGWDEYRASTQPIQDEKEKREQGLRIMELNRIHPQEILELAARNGINGNQFRPIIVQ